LFYEKEKKVVQKLGIYYSETCVGKINISTKYIVCLLFICASLSVIVKYFYEYISKAISSTFVLNEQCDVTQAISSKCYL